MNSLWKRTMKTYKQFKLMTYNIIQVKPIPDDYKIIPE